MRTIRFPLLLLSFMLSAGCLHSKEKAKDEPTPAEKEEAVRLQIFLDRANFSPGKIDGHYGDFTLKALALYRESQAKPKPSADENKPDAKPNLDGIDLSSVNPVFVDYAVTKQDMDNAGWLPEKVPQEAKLKWLPYRSVAEGIAEKFHCDRDFFDKLNASHATPLKTGDHVQVPNVPPFDLAAVKEAAKDNPSEDWEKSKAKASPPDAAPSASPPSLAIKVDTKTNMLQLREGDHLLAAYPITVGSSKTESPIGDWEVKQITRLPVFRWDKEMLNHGQRSGDYYNLPPGPRNPVGVMWIALNKKGIGLHGTNEPDSIGRSASHGCVRLANWDVVRLAEKIKPGVPVSIH